MSTTYVELDLGDLGHVECEARFSFYDAEAPSFDSPGSDAYAELEDVIWIKRGQYISVYSMLTDARRREIEVTIVEDYDDWDDGEGDYRYEQMRDERLGQ